MNPSCCTLKECQGTHLLPFLTSDKIEQQNQKLPGYGRLSGHSWPEADISSNPNTKQHSPKNLFPSPRRSAVMVETSYEDKDMVQEKTIFKDYFLTDRNINALVGPMGSLLPKFGMKPNPPGA
ncbi:unnamed protein product [Rodentolepis nana]|uniref:CDKL2 n=1 Tax=Rodentolepis nana TaxID=102285 RepID=A0A0R3TNB3_RODNA|nr:unnamed protein product [Rodentolepis nana]